MTLPTFRTVSPMRERAAHHPASCSRRGDYSDHSIRSETIYSNLRNSAGPLPHARAVAACTSPSGVLVSPRSWSLGCAGGLKPRPESSLERQLSFVRMKVHLANVMVQTTASEPKTLVSPETRRREMVQVEAAKLMLFVARQFNICENLQLVMGRALEEVESLMCCRSPVDSEFDLFPKEPPPDLTMSELKRVTAEMEERLRQELEKRGNRPLDLPLSAGRVRSNLSEILWLIESLELEMPSSQYADLDSENTTQDMTFLLTTAATSSPRFAKTLRHRQQQQQGQQQGQQERGETQSFFRTTTTVPADVSTHGAANDLLVQQSPFLDVAPQTLDSGSDEGLDPENLTESDVFSADRGSTVCGTPVAEAEAETGVEVEVEGSSLRLLQFMYDAINFDGLDVGGAKDAEVTMGSLQSQHGGPRGSEDGVHSSTKQSDILQLPGSTMKTSDTGRHFFSPWSRVFSAYSGSKEEELGEEESEEDHHNMTEELQLSRSTLLSPSVDSPLMASLRRPAAPPVQVYPLRRNLLEILRELYTNFNYKYHFQQFKPVKKGRPFKSESEYLKEMERRLSKQKNGRHQRATLVPDEYSGLLSWAEATSSTHQSDARRQSKLSRDKTPLSEADKDASEAHLEVSPSEQVLVDDAVLDGTKEDHDGTNLLFEDLGAGLFFVLKGREKESALPPKNGARRQSVSGVKSSEKGKKKGVEKKTGKAVTESDNPKGDSAAKGSNPRFDHYILYALNQSNDSRQALVHIDRSRLQNVKLRMLFGRAIGKETIAVDLPPNGAKSVLLLRPVKKKQQVVFDGALTFSERGSAKEVQETKEETKQETSRKSLQSRKSSTRLPSQAIGISSGLTQRTDSVFRPQLTSPNVALPGTETAVTISEVRDEKDVEHEAKTPVTETGGDCVQPTTVEDSCVDNKPETEQESEMEEDRDAYMDGRVGRKQTVRKGLFKQNMFGRPNPDDGSLVSGELSAPDWSFASEASPASKHADEWGVRLFGIEGESKGKEEFAEEEDGEDFLRKGFKEEEKGVRRKESARLSEAITENKNQKTTEDNRLCKADKDFTEVTPVDQWGLPFDGDKEAFEKNCVVLSVLQASEWQPDFVPQRPISGATSSARGEAGGAENEGRKSDEVIAAQGIPDSGEDLRKFLPILPHGHPKMTEEDIVSAVLHSAGTEGKKTMEEMITDVLHRIENDEQAGVSDMLGGGDVAFPHTQGGDSARVGSAATSCRLGLSSRERQEQQEEEEDQKQQAQQERHSRISFGSEVPSFPKLTPKNDRTSHSIDSTGSHRSSVSRKEGGAVNAGSSHWTPADHLLHPEDAYTGNFETEFPCSIEDAKGTPSAQTDVDGSQRSPARMSEHDPSVYYCKDCASGLHPDHHFGVTPSDERGTEDALPAVSSQVPSRMEQPDETHSKLVTPSVFTPDDKKEDISSAPSSAVRPALNLDVLLAGVTKATKKAPPLERRRRKKVPILPSLPQQRPPSPTRHRVYTESRPGGRVAIFAPEEAQAAGSTSTGKIDNTVKASKSIAASTGRAETFAKKICTSLHAYARRATANSNRPLDETQTGKTLPRRSVARTDSLSDSKCATLPSLSLLYADEAGQGVEDITAAEAEARELFLMDPARYDCVLDDLVKVATKKVQEEEERARELAAAAERRGSVKAADGFLVGRVKLHRHSLSSFHSSETVPRVYGHSESGKDENSPDNFDKTANHSKSSLPAEKPAFGETQVVIATGLDRLLEEQRRAKRIVAFILMEMRRMWQRRQMEANLALRAAVDRFIYRTLMFSWHFERRRVLNLRKLIHLLDRKTGRTAGWMPFYAKDRVVEDRFVWEPAPPHLSRPLRVVHRAMCLARRQRLVPLRTLRFQAHQKASSSPHLLYGYKRMLLEPYACTAVRLRLERRSRYVAPFQRPVATFSPQLEWMDGRPKKR